MRILKYILLFVLLIVSQVFVFNHLHFFGYFTLFIYIYFILKLPANTPGIVTVLLGFVTGLVVDIFANTPGMNSFALTLMSFFRYPVLKLFIDKKEIGPKAVGIIYLGKAAYFRYISILVPVFVFSLYGIESLFFFNLGLMIIKFVCSSLLTVGVLYLIESQIKE